LLHESSLCIRLVTQRCREFDSTDGWIDFDYQGFQFAPSAAFNPGDATRSWCRKQNLGAANIAHYCRAGLNPVTRFAQQFETDTTIVAT
jgi:hypothetical protein